MAMAGQFDPDVIGGPDTTVNGLAAVGGQAEGSIAANADASVLIVGFNDSRGFATTPVSLSGLARSVDGGVTWLPVPVGPGGNSTLPGAAGGSIFGDPDVKFDPTRNIFVFSSIFVRPLDGLQGMSIHTSNANGTVWSNPIEVSPAFITGEAADKEFIDVNPVTGRLHVSWTQFSANPTRILTTFTDDLGATWAPATQLVQAPMNGGVQASVPRVLPGTTNANSTVYVVWRNSEPTAGLRNVGCTRSLDGGATWDPPVDLDATTFPPEDQILGMDRVNTSPAMAIDHTTGRVYVVYQRNNATGTGDIALRTFVGACQTGPAVMLSSNPGNDRSQFVPFVSVDQSNGRAHVGWYDQDAADSGDLIETMHTSSINQGTSWSPPTPVTDRPFHAGYGNDTSQPNLGDYNQSVARSGNLYSVWAGNTVQPLYDEGQPAANQLFTPDMYVEKTVDTQIIAPVRIADTTTSDAAFCQVSGANGQPDPGETIDLQVKLDNYVGNPVVGAATLTGISATLSTTTPGVTINGATRTYADLAPLAVGNATTPFQFSLASNFVPGTIINFLLTVTTNQGSTELPIRVNTGVDGTPTILINEDFSVTPIGTVLNNAGWQSVKAGGAASPLVTHWAVSQALTPGNNAAYHNEAAAASWIRLFSPQVIVPTATAESRVTLDFDLVYDLEEEPSKLVEAYDGMTLRITDSTTGATVRSVLAEAFAEKIKTGNVNHFPRHLVRSSNTNYLEDMSVWSGPSGGTQHVSMRFPGQGMTGRTIQVRFEFTQDGFAVCTDNGAGRGPCGMAIDNIKLNAVPIVASTCVPSICGDGILQPTEQCDDGNTAAGDCCSPTCTFVAVGTVCRASAGQCDAAETCTGSSGVCPADGFVTNGTTCNDGNSCTQTDSCQAGACTGANPVTCSASDQCHIVGTCNPATGVCSNPAAADGTTCNDGNSCTQTDTCQTGACTGANPVTCTASDQCHVAGTCNPTSGVCSNPVAPTGTACNDGNACTQTDTCSNGACSGANPITCAALDQCHVAGTCDTATGTCSNPNIADGTTCNDGNSCTQTDTCQTGACTGANPVTCTASDQCHVAGTCDTTTGTCSNPAATDGTTCDDGDGCTQTDACQTGACAGGNPVVCTASDQCHDVGTCDSLTGMCSNPALVDGTACDDSDACTKVDACTAGTCTGTDPVVCAASDQCHDVGSCDPTTGMCSDPAAADGTACSDDNVCTVGETCQAGTCGAPQPLDCNDRNECTADTCDPKDGCVHTDGQCKPVIPAGGGCDCAAAPGSSNDHGLPTWTLSGLLALLGLGRRRRERSSTQTR
jgi:cysteine-rich repeat protein